MQRASGQHDRLAGIPSAGPLRLANSLLTGKRTCRPRMTESPATARTGVSHEQAHSRQPIQADRIERATTEKVVGRTKKIDKASAKLFELCATGEHIKGATVWPCLIPTGWSGPDACRPENRRASDRS
jgi:hypothetical protein